MNPTDKMYIIDSLQKQTFLDSEIYKTIKQKVKFELKLTELEKSLLILVIEHDPYLIEDYKKMLIDKIIERNEQK